MYRVKHSVRVALILLCCAVAQSVWADPAVARTQEIVAVVNEDAISDSDLSKRMRLITASSGLPSTEEIREKMQPQVLGGLISERLMLQEAEKLGIEVQAPEIDAGIAQIAQQNNLNPAQFLSVLKQTGVDVSTVRQQVEAQVAWSKVVKARLRPKITISERDIDEALARIQSKIGTTEYLVAEIFLPAGTPQEEAQVKRLMNNLIHEMKAGKASFFKLAQQFSQAAGSANGGDKGWVNEEQFSEEILTGLQHIEINQITAPLKSPDGYRILFLRDKRTVTEDTIPSREQIEYTIGTQRLDNLQRRHLMELRTASFVDIRV